jgi:hypothetical protein
VYRLQASGLGLLYRLTRTGTRQLKEETVQWERMTAAVGRILAEEA